MNKKENLGKINGYKENGYKEKNEIKKEISCIDLD
jgi:hypothetical protein